MLPLIWLERKKIEKLKKQIARNRELLIEHRKKERQVLIILDHIYFDRSI